MAYQCNYHPGEAERCRDKDRSPTDTKLRPYCKQEWMACSCCCDERAALRHSSVDYSGDNHLEIRNLQES